MISHNQFSVLNENKKKLTTYHIDVNCNIITVALRICGTNWLYVDKTFIVFQIYKYHYNLQCNKHDLGKMLSCYSSQKRTITPFNLHHRKKIHILATANRHYIGIYSAMQLASLLSFALY